MIKLSMVIPAYNAEPYIYELLDCLEKQIVIKKNKKTTYRDDVQVILIDDGSEQPLEIDKPWVEFYTNEGNKGVSYTRNRGIELSKGKFIHFMDADDLVPDNYFDYIIKLIDSKDCDYIDLSWKSLPGGPQYDCKLNSDSDSLANPSASTRIFKREFIGENRFSEKKDAAEDEDFTRHLGIRRASHICATEYMYFYRTYVSDSASKKFINGEKETHRIGYFYRQFNRDMKEAIEAIKKDDEYNEVLLLTYQNDVPEIETYCQVISPPKHQRVMEVKGEKCNFFNLIPTPIKADIVIWTKVTYQIGGIETFIYNFCACMHEKYKIVVLYEKMDQERINRVSKYARCVKYDASVPIRCDTLIINRISDNIPLNVRYKKSIQMAHCIKQEANWHIPQTRDAIVCVSNASKQSFGEEAKKAIVINNLTADDPIEKSLLLVSATRIGASDKQGNDERMKRMARLLKSKGIKFVWLYWGQQALHNAPEGLVYMGAETDVRPYIKMATYYVALSGAEAFSYSLIEALESNVPLIVTPLEQNKEMKIKDGVNAYIVPFDFDESFDVTKFLNVPKFKYFRNKQKLIDKWVDVIENTKPRRLKIEKPVYVRVRVTFQDLCLGRILTEGEQLEMPLERADELQSKGFIQII